MKTTGYFLVAFEAVCVLFVVLSVICIENPIPVLAFIFPFMFFGIMVYWLAHAVVKELQKLNEKKE